MKKLILITLFLINYLFGSCKGHDLILTPKEIKTSFWYGSGGVATIYPKAAIGYRHQRNRGGLDCSYTFAYLPPYSYSHGVIILPLFFPKPSLKKQFYFGASLSIHQNLFIGIDSTLPKLHVMNFAIGALLGCQFQLGAHYHFVEFKVGTPIVPYLMIPLPSLSYGVSF